MTDDKHPVEQIADMLGGKIKDMMILPDGTGGATVSYPLPADHWLTADHENIPPMPFRMGNTAMREEWATKIWAAGKYAVRCVTMNGKDNDFDPDALIQNLVVGMLGYWSEDGTSDLMGDPHDNPEPIPPRIDL